FSRDWSSDVCSSDVPLAIKLPLMILRPFISHVVRCCLVIDTIPCGIGWSQLYRKPEVRTGGRIYRCIDGVPADLLCQVDVIRCTVGEQEVVSVVLQLILLEG